MTTQRVVDVVREGAPDDPMWLVEGLMEWFRDRTMEQINLPPADGGVPKTAFYLVDGPHTIYVTSYSTDGKNGFEWAGPNQFGNYRKVSLSVKWDTI